MALTGTVDAANARIDFFVDFTDQAGTQTFATLYRRVGSATADAEPVRGLFGTTLLGEQAYVSDHEAPLDTEIWYTAAGGSVAATMDAGPFTIPSNGYVWMKDPGRPWADLRMDLCSSPDDGRGDGCATDQPPAWVGLRDKVRASDAGLFDILDAERPADVYARRKDITTTWLFLTRTLDSIREVYELYTAGGPLLLQLAAAYGMQYTGGTRPEDRYFQPGDLTESYLSQDQRRPVRLWSAPVVAVNSPIGLPQGTDTANWCALADTYGTYADLDATGYTWGQLASGEAANITDGYGFGPYGSGPYGDGG